MLSAGRHLFAVACSPASKRTRAFDRRAVHAAALRTHIDGDADALKDRAVFDHLRFTAPGDLQMTYLPRTKRSSHGFANVS
jgi:hypothetical protein